MSSASAFGTGPAPFGLSRSASQAKPLVPDAWRTDQLPFDQRPIYQFVLIEGYQEHSGKTWHRLFAGTAMIDGTPDNRWGYRRSDIDRIQRDGDMIVVERVLGWVPASYPNFTKFAGERK